MSVDYTPEARDDIDDAAADLAGRYGGRVANAFLTRLEATAARVDLMPLAYSLVDPPLPNHPGLRVVPVAKFESRLIFFTPVVTGILVVRVLLAASDWQTVLGD
jgi:plasmid stabilization system protein ParE